MHNIYASIITIGDELLIGQTIDTNSAFIGQELNRIGIWVKRRVAVGDSKGDIRNALDEEAKHSDIIIITGGLGPTADDITKPVLCEYFGGKMVTDEKVLAHVTYLFEHVFKRPLPLLERNRRQADVPDVCTVLMNMRGTAPGMWFEKEGRIFVSLPGVPNEMQGLVEKEVIPRLKEKFELPVILHKTLLTAGTGESMLAEKIMDWEENLPDHIKLAYLPHYGLVRLRMTSTGQEKKSLEKELDEKFEELKELIKEWLVVDEDLTLPQAIKKFLQENKKTIGTAESCTGGYIAHLLSRDPGSSKDYKGSIICYDNQVKIDILGVSEKTLDTVGAVSEETVIQMARGALKQLKSDYVIATSGILGPDRGGSEKPVGLVWIAVGNNEKIISQQFQWKFDRGRNMEMTTITALNMLRKLMREKSEVGSPKSED